MGLMGLGGAVAIAGGLLFVFVMLQAIVRGRSARRRSSATGEREQLQKTSP